MVARGEVIGRYRIVREIGRGGMGVVYEAVEVESARPVALKLIAPEHAADADFRERFATEVRAQAGLSSSYVVGVLDHGDGPRGLHLVTELMPDGDLGQLLRTDGPLPLRRAVELMSQVTEGLAAAHAAGIVHRDIKPANVLLDNRGGRSVARLTDFGVARVASVDQTDAGKTTHGFAVGTPAFQAPEIHTGRRADERSDLYALGCLIWSVLVGRPPYDAATDYQWAQVHLTAPVPQLIEDRPGVPDLNRILRTCLAKRSEQRYPDARALLADLRAARDALGVDDRFASPAPQWSVAAVDRPVVVRRRPLAFVAAMVSVLTVLIGTVAGGGWPLSVRDASSGFTPEQRVAQEIAAALVADGLVDAEQATCMAHRVVAQSGLARLRRAGVVADGHYVDDAMLRDDAVLAEVIEASVHCLDNA